jgi:hypothetical protein
MTHGDGHAATAGSALGIGLFGGGGLALDASGNLWINGPQIVTAAAQPAVFEATLIGNTAASQSYTMTNISASPLNLSAVHLSGSNPGEFSQSNNCPAQLQPGASCSITVSFTPALSGIRTATVNVEDDGPASPHQIPLNGIATGPVPVAPAGLVRANAEPRY